MRQTASRSGPAAAAAPRGKGSTGANTRGGPPRGGRGRGRGGDERAIFERREKEELSAALVKRARQTGQLNLSGRGLVQVPEKVWRINDLDPQERKALDVRLDQNQSADDGPWWEQEELHKLLLSSNKISLIPPDIANLTFLSTLDLRDNMLQSLPEEIGELQKLRTLNVSHNQITELPKGFYKLAELVTLNAEHNQIRLLDDALGYLHNLEEVNFSHNSLPHLPASAGFLTRVHNLNLSNNTLSSLAPEIGCMMGLQNLDLSHNQLTSIPKDLGECPHLKQLNLRYNQVQNFPLLESCKEIHTILLASNRIQELSEEELQWVTTVKVLDLRDNKLEAIPQDILKLQQLERLDLTNNSLTGIPLTLSLLPHLKSLSLEGNAIKSIRRDILTRGTVHLLKHLRTQITPEEIEKVQATYLGSLGELDNGAAIGGGGGWPSSGGVPRELIPDKFEMRKTRSLIWAGKGISHLSGEVVESAKEAEVNIVDLSKNSFTQFPQSLEVLYPILTELNLSNNQIPSVPTGLSACAHLQYLDLNHNKLTELDLSPLPNLREINISCNRFKQIPGWLFECPKLELLFMSDNLLEAVDVDGLSRLSRLATLDLQNNSIAVVPPELGNLTQLRFLKLQGNPFRNPRAAVLSQGTPALLSYLRDRIPA